ncbi:MAG: phytoene/squalene synthase family protein [Candidatus Sericytochromatia bacterium]
MLALYDNVSIKCSELVTKKYSTSFSFAIKTLDKSLHEPIYAIYGYVRLADEIVDSFHDFNKIDLLHNLKKETYKAIEDKISTNPIIHAFQITVNKYNIENELIESFLKSMEFDLYNNTCNEEAYKEYIYGSAEVVGLMCLRVFCENNRELYDSLKGAAKSLGAAFQKVNFLRDIQSDYNERGRIYFPNVNFEKFTANAKKEIEDDIQKDFDDAYKGIIGLPNKAKAGVYLAYIYYLTLFKKIKKLPESKILSERIRISNDKKLYLMCKSLIYSSILKFK